jgi:hypothetical protein
MMVLGPLLHIKNNNLPRGVRKVETHLNEEDLAALKQTIPSHERQSLLNCLRNSVSLYRRLRSNLFTDEVKLQFKTEEKVMYYFDEIASREIGPTLMSQ